VRTLYLILAAALITLGAACKPKAVSQSGLSPELSQAIVQIPDGTNVLAALDQKDYDNALAGLVRIQQSADETQQAALVTLRQHVRGVVLEASQTDPKAMDALTAIRAMMAGR
jgi:hypothetical protein